MPHSIHIRKALSCSRWQLTEKLTTGQCAKNERCEHAALNQMPPSNSSSQGSGISMWNRSGKIVEPDDQQPPQKMFMQETHQWSIEGLSRHVKEYIKFAYIGTVYFFRDNP